MQFFGRHLKLVVGFVAIGWLSVSYADMSIEGRYQGKNLYVQSPESEDGFGFCVNKVSVNGEPSTESPQTSAFQIDMSEFNVKVGDEVLILIEHEEGCKPKLLNPEVLLPKSTFVLEEMSCTPEGTLTWSTTNESGALDFIVEHYKWNKWVRVGETKGKGGKELSEYMFKLSPHSGENTVRVAQIDNSGKKRVTKSVTFVNTSIPSPSLKSSTGDLIEFIANDKPVSTKYEIFDIFGNIVKKGKSTVVDCSGFKPGIYHVNFDNKHEKFVKQ